MPRIHLTTIYQSKLDSNSPIQSFLGLSMKSTFGLSLEMRFCRNIRKISDAVDSEGRKWNDEGSWEGGVRNRCRGNVLCILTRITIGKATSCNVKTAWTIANFADLKLRTYDGSMVLHSQIIIYGTLLELKDLLIDLQLEQKHPYNWQALQDVLILSVNPLRDKGFMVLRWIILINHVVEI